MTNLRIGVVGSGFLAETRARCWAQTASADLKAVASLNPEKAKLFSRKHSVPLAFATAQELFESSEIDVVDLCVPNQVHQTLGVAAAEAGKHVICTKPLTAYVGQDLPADCPDDQVSAVDRRRMLEIAQAESQSMIDAASQAGVQLCYGENWVYAPGFRKMLDLLDEADAVALDLRGGESHKGSHSPYSKLWRNTGGGALLRLASHPIGAMLHLKRREGMRRFGRPIRPASISAEVGELTQVEGLDLDQLKVATGWIDVENWGVATLLFDDGSRAVAWGNDNLLGGMESYLEVMASNCRLRCNLSPNDLVRAYSPDAQVFGDAYLQEKLDSGAGWSTPMPDEDWTSGQLGMCQAFARDLAAGRPVESDGALGLDVVKVLYGAYVAAAEGVRFEL